MNNKQVTNIINRFFGKVKEQNGIKFYEITNQSGEFYRYEPGVDEVKFTTGSPVRTGRKVIFSSDYAFFSPVDTGDLYTGIRFTFQVNNDVTLKLICLDQDQQALFKSFGDRKCNDFQNLLENENKFLSPETKEKIRNKNILEEKVVDLIATYYPYNSQGEFTGYRDSEPSMDRFINAIFYSILGNNFDGYACKRVPLSNGESFHSEFTINKHNVNGENAKITQLELTNSTSITNISNENTIENTVFRPSIIGTPVKRMLDFAGSKYKTRSKSKNKTAKKVKSPKRNKTKKNTKNICAICYEVMNKNTDNVTTLCNHMFHTDCLRNWCMRNNNNTTCPICRADIRDTCIRINPNTNSNNNNVLVTFYPSQQEDMNNYLNTGNIGDQIEQVTNAQLNYAIYEIALNDNGDRYLRQIGDIYGMFEGEVLLSPLLTSPPGTPSPTSPASPLTPIRNHNNISDNNITSNTPMMSYQNYINNITNANNSNTPPNSQEDISGNINPLDFLYDTPDNSRFSGGMTKIKKSLKKKQRKTKKKGGKLSKREDSPPPPRQPSSRRNMEPINTQVLEARLLRVNEILLQRFGNDDERIDSAGEIQQLIRPGSFGSNFVYTNALGFSVNEDIIVDELFVTMIIGLYDPNRPRRQGGKNIKKKTKKNKTLKRKNNKKRRISKQKAKGIGGADPLFDNTNKLPFTASYIYSRDPNSGMFYFAFCRKVLPRRRIMINGAPRGAAGTDPKYHGKWGSFGGESSTKSNHTLQAAIKEISDEANIKLSHRNDVNIDKNNNDDNKLLNLKFYQAINDVGIFIFFMDFVKFEGFFPIYPNTRKSVDILNSSHGEIDTVSSFSMKQIKEQQDQEMMNNNNNFFLSYNLNTFNTLVIPYISNISNAFARNNYNITHVSDTNPRYDNNDRDYYIQVDTGEYEDLN